MSVIVIDCSYALALILQDESVPSSARQAFKHDMAAPAIWPMEIASAALNGIRRKRLTSEQGLEVCNLANELEVQLHSLESFLPADYLRLAVTYGLTPYDAVYIDLALKLRSALATCDKKMIEVARMLGITVFE